jgi:galactonate dehydratase
MALWDLLGKYHGVRVCDLLGGPIREQLKLYANGVVEKGASPSEAAEAAADIADRGFDLLSFIPAFDEGERAWLTDRQRTLTRQRLESVSERVGDRLDIAIESHGALAPRASVELADIVEAFDPVFYEEPIPPENIDALRRIRRDIDLPVATGERLLTVHDYRNLLQHPVPADIVQPDVNNCGGISQLKKIVAMAETEYLGVALHNSRGPVATAAAAHVSATLPNFLILEYFPDLPP